MACLFCFIGKVVVLSQDNNNNNDIMQQNEIINEERKISQILENFNKYSENDYKVDGFSLKIYKKNGFPYLEYIHDKTKAKILFVLIDFNIHNYFFNEDIYYFKAFSADDYGMVNFLQSCLLEALEIDFERFKISKENYFKSFATKNGLEIYISPDDNNQKLIEKIFKNFKSPYALQNAEFFEVVKRAVINKVSSLGNKTKPNNLRLSTRLYDILGYAEDIEKLTMNDVKKFYEAYIHPSNLFIIKNISVDEVNPSRINQFLKLVEKEYLNDYSYKNIDVQYPYKYNDRYLMFKETKDSPTNMYYANLRYDFKKLKINAKQADVIYSLDFDESFENDLKNFIKNLGYDVEKSPYIFLLNNTTHSLLSLVSENPALVTEDVLVENSKKINMYIKEKLQSLNDEELKKNCDNIFRPMKNTPRAVYKDYIWRCPYLYRSRFFKFLIERSIENYGEFFSNMIFDINQNNEISHSREDAYKNVKENLNVFEIFANSGPTYIDVY